MPDQVGHDGWWGSGMTWVRAGHGGVSNPPSFPKRDSVIGNPAQFHRPDRINKMPDQVGHDGWGGSGMTWVRAGHGGVSNPPSFPKRDSVIGNPAQFHLLDTISKMPDQVGHDGSGSRACRRWESGMTRFRNRHD